ncbi:polysaccharide pyruvyl transferase family protein [Providencia hangzhouensis]
MKVGLVTTHFTINYGAVLQAYALHKSILNLGYDCDVIDYAPQDAVYGNKSSYNFSNLRASVGSIIKFANVKHRKEIQKKKRYFSRFLEDKFNLSDSKFTSIEDVKNNISNYDAFVCGSDQIWNLNLIDDPVFFLQFNDVRPDANYIAYAPSVSERLTESQYQTILERTKHFNKVSIREKNEAEYINSISDKEVVNVIDPVFLFDKSQWNDVAQDPKIDGEYILCFEVSSDRNFTEGLKYVRDKLGLKLVTINTKPYNKHGSDYLLTDVSPEEFVGLLKNATFVFTSSFHATAFSVIYEKHFIAMANKKRSSRHASLLSHSGCEHRLVYTLDDLKKINLLDEKLHENTKLNISKIRDFSLKYLNDSLGQ